MTWNPVKDKSKYGVAINNFAQEGEYTIPLTVGNTVHVLEEFGEWFYGYVLPNRAVQGTFPKAFIHIKECVVDRTGLFEVVAPAHIPPFIQELTAALRDWGHLITNLYINRSPNFDKVYSTMNSLISDRKRMLSGQLLREEKKKIKHQITDNIDLVNKLLGMDLVVRDEHGNILNPDITSTIKLFRHHLEASENLNQIEEPRPAMFTPPSRKLHNSWTLKFNIKNIILRVPSSCEISLTFYSREACEGKETKDKPLPEPYIITEPYIFTWTPNGYSGNTSLYSTLVAFFTDLTSKVLMKDKLFLKGVVVREGAMISKDRDSDRRTSISSKKSSETDTIRRPFGLFLLEVSEEIRKQKELSLHPDILNVPSTELKVPFYACGEKESLELLFRKFMNSNSEFVKENSPSFHMFVNLSLYNGNIDQLRRENHNYRPFHDLPVSSPLYLSDVVVPGDVRNDLYVTLLAGEFPKVRNVEVTARVCNERGVPIPGIIYLGCGKRPVDEFRSVTYPNEPRWMETFKVALPIAEFRKAHLKFLFKHRSQNEVKDKNEKPFALSFVNLIQPNGTTLHNVDHELLVYKIDHKKWLEEDSSYMKLCCVKQSWEEGPKKKEECYSLSTKDSFAISTIFCSTKLTQKAELLALLEWGGSGSSCKTDLRRHLSELRNVPQEELIIFLPDTLDVLFEILMNSSKDTESDNLVFEALVHVIYMVGEMNKHEAHQSVLITYIEKNFHATLAYNKLITILRSYIDEVCIFPHPTKTPTLNKAMKYLHYMVKFIIRSRELFYELYAKGQQLFQESLTELLNSIAKLMACTSDSLLSVQGLCLKYLATIIPDIMTEFDSVHLCYSLIHIVNNLEDQRLSPQRLTAMCEICHSPLFVDQHCRAILLAAFVAHIKKFFAENEEMTDSEVALRNERRKGKLKNMLGEDTPTPHGADSKKTEELKLSVKILCDILNILFSSEVGPTVGNLMMMLEELLHDILSIVSKMRKDDSMLMEFVAVLISLLRQAPETSLLHYLDQFDTTKLTRSLTDLLMVSKDLIENPVFPPDWCEMIFLTNSVLMKVLHLISKVMAERMKDPFNDTIWSNFFLTAVKFTTQSKLQLERFSCSKRNKILGRYKDLRLEVAMIVKQLWFGLSDNKIRFIAKSAGGCSLVGPFLEMSMLPELEMRRICILILFDMMQCEFYSLRIRMFSVQSDMPNKVEERIKGKFDEFEKEMLEHLDSLIESGCGDEHYREIFVQVMKSLCKENSRLQRRGCQFVDMVGSLMERLLQYRTIIKAADHSLEIRMSCTVSLLEFYSENNKKELYLRYLYKLFDLHCACDNYTEAGYTLQLHADQLSWEHHEISKALKSPRYPHLQYHDDLKEQLYMDIIHHFEKGQMWEVALKICKELVQRYEDETMEYDKLAKRLSEMAKLYEKIMDVQIIRPAPEYFRVAYYGRGFPAFLQNKVFVYRGNGFERLIEFQSRILDPFPNVELMKTLSSPSAEDKESVKQYIQINKVDCIVEKSKMTSTAVAERIRQYYEVNHIDTFTYSRPFHRGQKDPENEFASLWTEKTTLKTLRSLPGVLRCFAVEWEEKIELTPLDNAIAAMTSSNQEIENLIRKQLENPISQNLENLRRKATGMVDAAVMGGVKNYEKAFLTDTYIDLRPEDSEKIEELKGLISRLVPLLELSLEVLDCCATTAMAEHLSHLVEHFKQTKELLQENYGFSPKPADLEQEVQFFKRRISQDSMSSRSSHYSTGGGDNTPPSSILPRLTPGKGVNSTLPRGMRLSSISSNNVRKDKKGLKYLRGRRESFSRKESTTKWFDPSFSNDFTPHSSPGGSRPKRSIGLSRTESQLQTSRPNSITSSLKSTSSVTSLDKLSAEGDIGGGGVCFLSEPTSPEVVEVDSPPPLPAKNRNSDNGQIHQNFAYLTLQEVDIPPEKPPRPDLAKGVNGTS